MFSRATLHRSKRALRDLIARAVSSLRPELFYFAADKSRREPFTVRSSPTFLDVISERDARIIRLNRANAVYIVDVVECFEYYFGSVAPITVRAYKRSYSMVDFSTPRFHLVNGFEDFPLMYPSMTESFITVQQYLDFAALSAGDTVLDLGAYSGLTSIAFSKAVGPSGAVIALEPDPTNHTAATTNFGLHRQLNGLANITLLKAAVTDHSGSIELSAEGSLGSAITDAVGRYRGATLRVDSLTLDDLAERLGLSHVAFVKMDIEGAEETALRSAARFFERFQPRIIVEPHSVKGVRSDRAVMSILDKFQYDCELIDQTGVVLPLIAAVPRQRG